MSGSKYASLEDVVQDPLFPAVDVALRRGRHVDRDDADWYGLLRDAQDHLEPFYRRYSAELVQHPDGYFYLLPNGDQLGKRHLSAAEMLVGQALALSYLDPATVKQRGLSSREAVLERLAGLVGERELFRVLEPRRRKFDERVAHDSIRTKVDRALRGLAALGFIELVDDDGIRSRSPLLRFAEPVRGLEDPEVALERLVAQGKAVVNVDAIPDDDADDDATAEGEA
jgi:chromosome partition protein MukE